MSFGEISYDLAAALERATHREPVGAADGKSGAPLERVTLDDGSTVITKLIRPAGDWIMRNTHDEGRAVELWERGILHDTPAVLDHGVLGVVPRDDGWLLVMRDLGRWIFGDGRRITPAENERLIRAFHELHRTFAGRALTGLCPLADRYSVLSPAMAARERDGGALVPQLAERGWQIFVDLIDDDTAGAITKLLDDPSPLVTRLARRPSTLIHGDMKLANIGLTPDAVVAVDWGTLTGVAPPGVEWAWYIATAASSIDCSRDEILDEVRRVEGEEHDPVGLALALLGALIQLGWNKALDAREHADASVRARERADLDWWLARAREVLPRVS